MPDDHTPDDSGHDGIDRRALIGALAAGGVGAVAGCVDAEDSGGDGGDDGPTPPDMPWSDAELADMDAYYRYVIESLDYQNQQLAALAADSE